jgi:polyisoprenoid-binding protein YceI
MIDAKTAEEESDMAEASATTAFTVPTELQGEWAIDRAHTSLSFVARYLMVTKVRGRFADFEGSIHIGPTLDDSRAEITINAGSIQSDDETRDGHLRSPDFLEVERFPTLAFRSTKVELVGETSLRVVGDLTIRDVTRPVTLDVEFEGTTKGIRGDERVAFSAGTEIDREDWGVTWNMALEAGGVLVGKRIKIELEVQAIRQAPEAT